ncbi:MAG TPA: hypothetical protein VE912_09120 [Bacteroidales bacterium]|nr:hypothetical protein [Bacteroidales bacterium]
MDFIENTGTKLVLAFATIGSFLLTLFQMMNIDWVIKHMGIILSSLLFIISSSALLFIYGIEIKRKFEKRISNLESKMDKIEPSHTDDMGNQHYLG